MTINPQKVYAFGALPPDLYRLAGGKGARLARLFAHGYPVPDGMVILSTAFDGGRLHAGAWDEILIQLKRLRGRKRDAPFAVRSSAQGEDSSEASFAGALETVLDAKTDHEIEGAIYRVVQSGDMERVRLYRLAHGLSTKVAPAVVIQKLVRAEYAGVLFTADPVQGDLMHFVGNYAHGLGDRLVSGRADAETFSIHRITREYSGPQAMRGYAAKLFGWAARLDDELGCPQDIEWAVAGGRVHILQSRPITSLREFNPATGEFNSSHTGDFLWSNGNAAEIQPEVMTLLTWSIGRKWGEGYGEWWSRIPMNGNIGGRSYFNISIQVAPFARLPGLSMRTAMRFVGDWWGRIPEGVTIPLVPFSLRDVFFKVLPMTIRAFRRHARYSKRIPEFVAGNPAWCRTMHARIRSIQDGAALASLWRQELKPQYCFGTAMAGAANSNRQVALQAQLSKWIGEADANILLSHLGGPTHLESLGPVVSLARVARGEMSHEEYLERYGHRGPYEFELARPQPGEGTAWLDGQLSEFAHAPFDADAMLAQQREKFEAAWRRFCKQQPAKFKKLERQLEEVSFLARRREEARSEITRVMGALRLFALRAGELTGVGDDVFHLTIEELLRVLEGDQTVCAWLPARKSTYERYCALPPYPPVISGRFDPVQWAADPNRRSDVFDSHGPLPAMNSGDIRGFAGAAGVVEGVVRRIDRVEDSNQLQPGEILVTVTTNIGWTPLFPRAAALVTDVGAPLSHAAIVARELGIPAVVGCHDATARLRTGDRVRVDGSHGTVSVLAQSSSGKDCGESISQ
jgi:phosphohistidine swiveling domain-containing protein